MTVSWPVEAPPPIGTFQGGCEWDALYALEQQKRGVKVLFEVTGAPDFPAIFGTF